jgi:hypothetical protein
MSKTRCIALQLPIPAIPLGLSLTPPTIPGVKLDVELCCKLPLLDFKPIPIPIPPFALATVLEPLKGAITAINAYVAALPFDCPLE